MIDERSDFSFEFPPQGAQLTSQAEQEGAKLLLPKYLPVAAQVVGLPLLQLLIPVVADRHAQDQTAGSAAFQKAFSKPVDRDQQTPDKQADAAELVRAQTAFRIAFRKAFDQYMLKAQGNLDVAELQKILEIEDTFLLVLICSIIYWFQDMNLVENSMFFKPDRVMLLSLDHLSFLIEVFVHQRDRLKHSPQGNKKYFELVPVAKHVYFIQGGQANDIKDTLQLLVNRSGKKIFIINKTVNETDTPQLYEYLVEIAQQPDILIFGSRE